MEFEACAEAVKDTSDFQLMEAARKSTHMLKTAWEKVRDDGTIKELTNIGHLDELSETPCLIVLLSTLTSLAAKELLARGFREDEEGGLWKSETPENIKVVKTGKEVKKEDYTNPIDKVPDSYLLTALQYAVKKMNEYYDKAKKAGDQSEEHAMAIAFDMLVQFCDKELTMRENKKNDSARTAS